MIQSKTLNLQNAASGSRQPHTFRNHSSSPNNRTLQCSKRHAQYILNLIFIDGHSYQFKENNIDIALF